jgi:long-chain acyl-CoA synthetase
MEFKNFTSVHAMLQATAERHRDRAAYRTIVDPVSGRTESVSWGEFDAEVRRVARSLIQLGVEPDDKVCILSYSCYRWALVDVAVQSIGSCTVGIYQSLLPNDCRYIIDHCDAVLVFAQDAAQLEKLRQIRAEIPRIRRVVVFEGEPADDGWVMSFERFLELGTGVEDAAVTARIAGVTPETPAAIVYTSGTTGMPKGAVLTHDNITFTAESVLSSVEIRDGDECMLFLPLAHIFARTCLFTALIAGSRLTFARSLDTLAEDFRIARPHWFPSVPRVYEKVYSRIVSGAEAKGGLALAIFRWACRVGDRVSDCLLARRPIPAQLGLQYKLATKLVFGKVHAALGGRVRWCISGGAPLNPVIGKFFHAAGVLILEGIGMTENTSYTNVNRVDNYRFGWVGLPGPGIEQRIGDDGEVMYRGRNVMREYYKMPEETAETLTADGWQHTGDLGEIDEVGFLRITGRKKDLIITAGGKNIAPFAIEGLLATSKYISQVCVVGDRRKYLTALVSVDQANVEDWAREQGIQLASPAELASSARVVDLVRREIEEKNRELASFETIKDFRIVEEFTIENGLLTPTMKVKRAQAIARYADLVEEMYGKS